MSEAIHDATALQALRGLVRLTVDAVGKTTDLVEAMHAHAGGLPAFLVSDERELRNGRISRFVYECVRRVNGGIGWSIDLALAPFAALPVGTNASPAEQAVVAALNGVLGDHLVATRNPLALPLRLRRRGRALVLERQVLAAAVPEAASRVVVLVHGLCMNDLQWNRGGHDHGAALARDLDTRRSTRATTAGFTSPLNGRELASQLERLVLEWPVRVREIAVLGHSMGGLVARSACHYGTEAGHAWVGRLRRLVFLATPHHGAPLERGGSRLQALVGKTPYAAPLARLGMIRSAGITDLRHGNVVDDDWQHGDRFAGSHDTRCRLPLPAGVDCFAVAASLGARAGDARDRLLGDGFVPRASALGEHPDPARCLDLPADGRWVGFRMNHWDVLDRPVYGQLRRWLAGGSAS